MTISRRFLLEGLSCQASIGIYDAERQAKQSVLIDAELLLRGGTEPKIDSVNTTIDYDVIRDTIHNLVGYALRSSRNAGTAHLRRLAGVTRGWVGEGAHRQA